MSCEFVQSAASLVNITRPMLEQASLICTLCICSYTFRQGQSAVYFVVMFRGKVWEVLTVGKKLKFTRHTDTITPSTLLSNLYLLL